MRRGQPRSGAWAGAPGEPAGQGDHQISKLVRAFPRHGLRSRQGSAQLRWIYTGTETRDPEITDQLLQQYESYGIVRYFSNIRPGANLGAWVDTYDIRSIDRYPEQLWDGLFAKAPEQTLFNGAQWPTRSRRQPESAHGRSRRRASAGPSARAAGRALPTRRCTSSTTALDELGNPVGIASYRPPHASGEDFLHNYIGNLGVPIELYPEYPTNAHTILLTEAAASDPQIIAKIQASLHGGANIIVTSGFLAATQGKGFEQLAEWHATGHVISIDRYFDGYGAGAGKELKDAWQGVTRAVPGDPFLHQRQLGDHPRRRGEEGFPDRRNEPLFQRHPVPVEHAGEFRRPLQLAAADDHAD